MATAALLPTTAPPSLSAPAEHQALPPHIALAEEPIPAQRDPDFDHDLPDMRSVVPIEQMIEWLSALDDAADYSRLFRKLLSSIGQHVMVRIEADGSRSLTVSGPVDPQIRHRSRWSHFLFEHLDDQPTRRDALEDMLIAEGRYSDERAAEPRQTTAVMRAFLRIGGRIVIDPDGRLSLGEGVPRLFNEGTDADAQQCIDATRAMSALLRRWRSFPHVKRAVRMAGRRTNNGWIVLKAKAAAEAVTA